MSWSIWINYKHFMHTLEVIHNNSTCSIYFCKLGATLTMCQQHLGLALSIIMSVYRYLRILCFFIVLQWQLYHCFCPQLQDNPRSIFTRQLSAHLLLDLTLEISILILNGSCLIITVWDDKLMLSLYPSRSCWWSSLIFFVSCCHKWGNITLQQCILESFPLAVHWKTNSCIPSSLIEKNMLLQILCPVCRVPSSRELVQLLFFNYSFLNNRMFLQYQQFGYILILSRPL